MSPEYPDVSLWVVIKDGRSGIPAFGSLDTARAWASGSPACIIGLDAHREERVRVEIHPAQGTRAGWESIRETPRRVSLAPVSVH